MECAPDWPKTLQRASFRGVSFFVESDDIQYGRRIKVHEFPNRDRPYIEDLGEKAIEFSVTAYLASNNVLSEKDQLVKAMRRRGPGSLVLPTEGSMQVVSYGCTRKHSKDKLGFIAFDLKFHEAGTEFGTFTVPMLERLVAIAGQSAIGAIAAEFLRGFGSVGETSWVVNSAAGNISTWVATIDELRLGLQTNEEFGSELRRDITDVYARAQTLAYSGQGVIHTGGVTVDLSRPDIRSDLPGLVSEIMGGLRLAAVNREEAIEALEALAAFDIDTFAGQTDLATTATAEKRNEQAINSLFRRHALVELAIAAAEMPFVRRADAIRARATVAELFERELSTANGELFAIMDEVRARAALAISRKVADIRPTVTVEANASLPSLLWSWRLYADVSRADELSDRNNVRHPAFMPPAFEAEAP